jgi:hypothetical protein
MSTVTRCGSRVGGAYGGSTPASTLVTCVCGECRHTSSVVWASSESGGIVWLGRITMC